jgi:uncharacterized protein YfbU (UPF0304 family)
MQKEFCMNKESKFHNYFRIVKTNTSLVTRSSINKHNAHTDAVGVDKFKPDSN